MGVNELVQIGTRIKQLRKEKGFKQNELADKANIPCSTLANYENNKREPNQEQIEKIAKALDVPVYDLLGISTDQLLQPLKDEVVFLNYLLSLGYKYEDMFYENNYGYDRCIYIIDENKNIPLTKAEYDNLKKNIKKDVEQELSRLREYKNI
ncbi:MAG: helix-turn-helix domain-containing protein [Lachnospiraceae bacterium]